MKMRHTVLMPIEVPTGDHCWYDRGTCKYFSNEDGHPICDFDLGDLKYDTKTRWVRRPDKCLELKGVEAI